MGSGLWVCGICYRLIIWPRKVFQMLPRKGPVVGRTPHAADFGEPLAVEENARQRVRNEKLRAELDALPTHPFRHG